MARFRDESIPVGALEPHLHGETLKYWAFGVKQPPIWLICILMLLAILPGAIAVALLTKEYLVGLTDTRLVVLHFSGGKVKVKEVIEYQISELTNVTTSNGSIFTNIKIDDPEKPFTAKFHRAGAKTNREQSQAIAQAISVQS
jgi:hypothetical protein